MKRLFLVLIMLGVATTTAAQGTTAAAPGDPPLAALISISRPDENGIVTITGAAGAVFPGAQVAVRNLYTEEILYTTAGITGAFTARLYGPGNTPFHISPAANIPLELRDQPGSLPGGPGTILYGGFPEVRQPPETPVTPLVVDGNLDDWRTHTENERTLRNLDSIYAVVPDANADYERIRVQLNANGTLYNITLNPRTNETAVWEEVSAIQRDLGTIAVAAAVGEAIELRIPLAPILTRVASDTPITLAQVDYLDAEGNIVESNPFPDLAIPTVEEQDGIVHLNSRLGNNVTRFSISGPVAGGASTWHARARVNQLALAPGDELVIEMDVQLTAPDAPETLTSLAMIGEIGLLPVTDGDGLPVSGATNASNGWSTMLTSSGLAVESVRANIPLGELVVPPPQVIRRDDGLLFAMDAVLTIPEDLPPGVYVPSFEGFGQVGDGVRFRWRDNGLLGTGDGNLSAFPSLRMPIVLNIGVPPETTGRLLWTLFNDTPSNGSRGLMAEQDQARASLSNRVRFNSPTYIVPPSTDYNDNVTPYAIEPYLVNMLPNTYNSSAAPLLPLLFPNGRVSATVRLPDGTTENLSSAPVVQNALSSPALDERTRFGEQSPVDTYRLVTFNELYRRQLFEQYGDYEIELTGFVEDVWGNRYEGGGVYRFMVAEQLDVSPAVLPGTPFAVGDVLHPGVHVSPGVPAEVSVRVRVFPLDGGDVIEATFDGVANPYGVFQPDDGFTFETAGEYIADYEVRYTDGDGRLWAGSLRGAGVIGERTGELVAHGERGVVDANAPTNPAWYVVESATTLDTENARLRQPYHSGDVAWITDSADAGLLPSLRLQDTLGRYADWLLATHPDYTSPDGTPLARLQALDSLPVVSLPTDAANDGLLPLLPGEVANESYAYTSFVKPGLAVRQFVTGGEQVELPLLWSMDDPLNEQIGAGASGARPGDYAFLFGGGIVRNDDADVRHAAIYGALGVVIGDDDELGARVLPPFRDGALLTVNEQAVDMFFHPTAARPGDVLEVGDVLSVAGQVAPTLDADVSVTITAPSGETRAFSGRANPVGYFYDPAQDFMVNEIGLWTVQVNVQHSGRTAAGLTEPPLPSGGVLGADGGRFTVYVVPAGAAPLAWGQPPDLAIAPGFPFNLAVDPPEGWTEVSAYVTARFPQQVIEDGNIPTPGRTLTYQYNPTALNRTYPFFEGNDGRVSGADSADSVYLTFAFTGLNADGDFDIAVRPVVIRHDRLLALE